jgi:hypothetical protein
MQNTQNTLCGQNVEFVCVKHGGTYSVHCVLKSLLGTNHVMYEVYRKRIASRYCGIEGLVACSSRFTAG